MSERNATWVGGYQPRFVRSVSELPTALLLGLVGQCLDHLWLLWHLEDDDWFADAPVLLEFGELQLECCAFKFDEYSVTTDTVDRGRRPLLWFGGDVGPLQWRDAAALEGFEGKSLRSVSALEYQFSLAGGQPSWILVGLEFVFDEGALRLVNGLDENEILEGELDDDMRRVPLQGAL